MQKLRPREVKGLAQGQISNQLQSRERPPAWHSGQAHVLSSSWWWYLSPSRVKWPFLALQRGSQTVSRVLIMQTGPVTEGSSATLWASEGGRVCEPLVSKLQSLHAQGDLGCGLSACSLGLCFLSWWSFHRIVIIKGPESKHGGSRGLWQLFHSAFVPWKPPHPTCKQMILAAFR